MTTTATQNLLVPAYLTSTSSGWTRALQMPTPHGQNLFVVAGPPGPGGFSQPTAGADPNLRARIADLQARRVTVLGYVWWPTSRTVQAVKADVVQWANNYPEISGVLFDDAFRSDDADLANAEATGRFTQDLFGKCCYSPGTAVFNWGGYNAIMAKYVACQIFNQGGGISPFSNAIHWVTFEGSESAYINHGNAWTDASYAWVHDVSSYRIVHLIYNATSSGATINNPNSIFTNSVAGNAGYVYATDGVFPGNTWGQVANNPLWTNEQSFFSNRSTSLAGRALGSEVYAYSPSQCPAPAPI